VTNSRPSKGSHPVGPLQERRRDGQAERLGGLEVDDQLEMIDPAPEVRAGPSASLGLWHLAQPLEEAPAVALEVECLVDAVVPQVIV
jgi:hypothetical protein